MSHPTIKTLLAGVLSICSMIAHAETIQFQVPACTSDDLLSEFTQYIIKEDTSGMMQLLKAGRCTILTKGDTVSVIERGFSKVKIRYSGVALYVAAEAVR